MAWHQPSDKPLSEELIVVMAEAVIFLDNEVNTMAADALAPCIARSLAALALIVWDKWAFVFHKEGFQLPVPY